MSRKERIDLASAPTDEDCAQVGSDGYSIRGMAECRVLRRQILREAAAAGVVVPESLSLSVRGNWHDLGIYYELVATFDEGDEAAAEAALWMEGNIPRKWDEEARAELELARGEKW